MGIPSEMRDAWASRRKKNAFFIASPAEEQRIRNASNCEYEGFCAGAMAASIAWVASAVPMLAAVRWVPWAKANLSYLSENAIVTAELQIYKIRLKIMGRSMSKVLDPWLSAFAATYFITKGKTMWECERRNTQNEKSA